MARIAGINIPDHKRVEVGLTYIYGIGRSRAVSILESANVDGAIKVGELTEDQAPNGYWMLSGTSSPSRFTGKRAADTYERKDP